MNTFTNKGYSRLTANSNYSNINSYGSNEPDIHIKPPFAATEDSQGNIVPLLPRVINEQVSTEVKQRSIKGYITLGDMY